MAKMPQMIGVTSSNIESIGFDEIDGMFVSFKNGTTYLYANVKREEFDAVQSASSVGSAFHSSIKKVYAGVSITG